jgi:uncharacterized membrane protein YkvA (DUF1232 family)
MQKGRMYMKPNNKLKTLKQNISIIFIALRDKDTPIYAKLLAILTIVYALSPVDIISDVLGLVGIIDDAIIIPILIIIIKKLIPLEILEKNKKK